MGKLKLRTKLVGSVLYVLILLLLISALVCVVNKSAVVSSAESVSFIPDGVYEIRNRYYDDNMGSYGTFYLRASGTDVIHSSYNDGGMSNNMQRYWRVTGLGSGIYVLRNMANEA